MLIEINYQQPSQAQGTGSVQARRLVEIAAIKGFDPHPTDATKSVLTIAGSGSGFVALSSTYTLNETYDAFKARYGQALANPTTVSSAPAVQNPPPSQGSGSASSVIASAVEG